MPDPSILVCIAAAVATGLEASVEDGSVLG